MYKIFKKINFSIEILQRMLYNICNCAKHYGLLRDINIRGGKYYEQIQKIAVDSYVCGDNGFDADIVCSDRKRGRGVCIIRRRLCYGYGERQANSRKL